jgi:predicted Zn finger-like uncharacterized protein
MFTVCPKCALTLVVTAADLRVAQGYVRCGRCSNVFNALARLSEDRTGAIPSQAPAPKQSQPRSEVSGTFRTKAPPDSPSTSATRESQVPSEPKTASTGSVRQPESLGQARQQQEAAVPAKLRQPRDTPGPDATPSAGAAPRTGAAPRPDTAPAEQPRAAPPSEPKRYGDDSVVDEDLEFKPDETDINKVFVEPPPSPKFAAATGTFKTLKLEAENASRAAQELARSGEREQPPPIQLEPVNTQVDVEIDPDLLATMAQLTSNRLERLKPPPPPDSAGPPVTGNRTSGPEKPAREAAKPEALKASGVTPDGGGINQGAVKPTLGAPPERPQAGAKSGHRANSPPEAAKAAPAPARASDLVRTSDADTRTDLPDFAQSPQSKPATAFETSQALRDALAPRKRRQGAQTGVTASEQPTSSFDGMWAAGSVALLFLLLLQIVHHYRHDLAANSTLNGPLTAVYAALGIPIVPRWDLTAYEVRQLGASTGPDAPGQITVRASVKNTGHQAQPLPLLRVTLQDRFGNRIASRDVAPQSYLPRAIPRSSVLAAGQRVDAEMAFVDPGANAVGFEIDACLPAPGGATACSNDAPR